MRLLGAFLLLFATLPVAAANATESETISAKALTSHGCDDSEWHFVITGLQSADDAPTSISVTWADGGPEPVTLGGVSGGTAHYRTTAHLSSTVTGATAEIYAGWAGQFNLSHGPCGSDEGAGSGGGTEGSVPASTPKAVEDCDRDGAVVTITAAAHVTYRLNGEVVEDGDHFVAADAAGHYTANVTAEAEAGFTIDGAHSWDLSGTLDCAAAGGGTTTTISAKALTEHECDNSEWHFVITGLTSDAQAPKTISVTFSGVATPLVVELEDVTGGTAHYRTTEHLDLVVTGATADISGEWDGQFNLSHGPCNDAGEEHTATGLTPMVDESCDSNSVTVTIVAAAHVSYWLNGAPAEAGEHTVAADSDGDYVVVVKAQADAGFTLTGESEWDLSGTLDCEAADTEIEAGVPEATQLCAQNAAAVMIPDTENVSYTLNGAPVSAGQHLVLADEDGDYDAVVHATAAAGFVLTGAVHWDLSGTLDCEAPDTRVSAETPKLAVDCTAGGVVVTIPATPHVTYTLNDAPADAGTHAVAADSEGDYAVTVKAAAETGFSLVGQSTFTFTGNLSCGTTNPPPGSATVTVMTQPCTTGTSNAVVHIEVAAGSTPAAYSVTRSVGGAAATPVATVNLPDGDTKSADVTVPLVEDVAVRIMVTTGSTTLKDVTLTANCTTGGGTTPPTGGTGGTGGTGTTGGTGAVGAGTGTGGVGSGGSGTDTSEETDVLGTKTGRPSGSVPGVLAATGQLVPLPILVGSGLLLVLLGLLMLTAPRRVVSGLAGRPGGKHHRS